MLAVSQVRGCWILPSSFAVISGTQPGSSLSSTPWAAARSLPDHTRSPQVFQASDPFSSLLAPQFPPVLVSVCCISLDCGNHMSILVYPYPGPLSLLASHCPCQWSQRAALSTLTIPWNCCITSMRGVHIPLGFLGCLAILS